MKRWRMPTAKPGELKMAFGKEPGDHPDLMYCYGGRGSSKRDGVLLGYFFETARMPENGRTLRQELESRGFDITTLKFSIQRKPVEVSHPKEGA